MTAPLEAEALELSLMVFLTEAFPDILVADQAAYSDPDGKIELPPVYDAGFLVAHDRVDYRSVLVSTSGPRPIVATAPSHVISIMVIAQKREYARELLSSLRRAAPFYHPFGAPNWVLFPSCEKLDWEMDGYFHFHASYCIEEAYPISTQKPALEAAQ